VELDLTTIIIVTAQIAVAIGTILLAFSTRRAIRKSEEWNKRIEERTLEWNKRNEWTRVLPFLSLEKAENPESMEHGWFKHFTVAVKNIGLGPVIFFIVEARQGKNEFKQLVPLYHPDRTGHCRPIGVNNTPLRIKFKTVGTKALEETPPPIVVSIAFWDVFGRPYEVSYELHPVSTGGTEKLDTLSDPRIISFKMNGRDIKIPRDTKDLSNIEFQDMGIGEPFVVNL